MCGSVYVYLCMPVFIYVLSCKLIPWAKKKKKKSRLTQKGDIFPQSYKLLQMATNWMKQN